MAETATLMGDKEGHHKSGDCPMMGMMSSPQGKGHADIREHMRMCRQMMQHKEEAQHAMMEVMISSQEQLLQLIK